MKLRKILAVLALICLILESPAPMRDYSSAVPVYSAETQDVKTWKIFVTIDDNGNPLNQASLLGNGENIPDGEERVVIFSAAEGYGIKKIILNGTELSEEELGAACTEGQFSFTVNSDISVEIIFTEAFTVNFLNFDGNVFASQKVKAGSPVNYDAVNTDQLYKRIDEYTEMKFLKWDIMPETVNRPMSIQALYTKATISLEGFPEQAMYKHLSELINLEGLDVKITIEEQIAGSFKLDGQRASEFEIHNISDGCTANFKTAKEALSKSNTAEIKIYPPGCEFPIMIYDIAMDGLMGDADGNGVVDSADAALVLTYYACVQTKKEPPDLMRWQFKNADVNNDGVIDPMDAALILTYYSKASTIPNPSWDSILK